jgi:uncharacterized protein YbjT (DUF2867 family)
MAISLVVGGTGLVGSHVLKQLALVEECPIAVLRRIPNDLPDNVLAIEVDFEELLTSGDLPHCDHLYLCLGTTIKVAGNQEAFKKVDFDYCLGIAQMAEKSGASVISLVSSVGANAKSKNFYLRTKGQLEEAIKLLNFSRINIYRPGLLIGDRQETRSAEKAGELLSKLIDPLLVGSLSKYRSVKGEVLAQTMVRQAKGDDGVHYFHFKEFYL